MSNLQPTQLEQVLSRLDGLVNWEKRMRRAAARFSLEPMRDLIGRVGVPTAGRVLVHVAGTKGKGSVATWVARGLQQAGWRVGRYGSPHVERINERMEVAGVDVSDQVLTGALSAVLEAHEYACSEGSPAKQATWFDLVTAAALRVFEDAECDAWVIECGLGGRLDSTNVLEKTVAVVTNIDLEHTEVLGSTRALIAAEKAGILRSRAGFVCGVAGALPRQQDDSTDPEDALSVLAARAEQLGLVMRRPASFESLSKFAQLSMVEQNLSLAREVLDELGQRGVRDLRFPAAESESTPVSSVPAEKAEVPVVSSKLLDELEARSASLPGRFERLQVEGAQVVLDGAHVPSSLMSLLRDLDREDFSGPTTVLFGLARNKDLTGMLKALKEWADRLVCTSVGSELFLTPREIAAEAERLGLIAETVVSPRTALTKALEYAKGGADRPAGRLLVTGSLYLVGAVRPLLTQRTDPC